MSTIKFNVSSQLYRTIYMIAIRSPACITQSTRHIAICSAPRIRVLYPAMHCCHRDLISCYQSARQTIRALNLKGEIVMLPLAVSRHTQGAANHHHTITFSKRGRDPLAPAFTNILYTNYNTLPRTSIMAYATFLTYSTRLPSFPQHLHHQITHPCRSFVSLFHCWSRCLWLCAIVLLPGCWWEQVSC